MLCVLVGASARVGRCAVASWTDVHDLGPVIAVGRAVNLALPLSVQPIKSKSTWSSLSCYDQRGAASCPVEDTRRLPGVG